jgi:hypothetical protein
MIRLPWQDSEETRANKEELARRIAEQKEKDRMEAEKEEQALPCYQVGVSKDNRVTLRLGDGTYYSTLTMTNEGVDRMIRMLEAAKDQCNDDKVEE